MTTDNPPGGAGGRGQPASIGRPGYVVRPYTLTGGRTEATRRTLAIETLVTTTPQGLEARSWLDGEQEAIAVLCRSLMSVAEVAAKLHLPIGVARVLISDLADAGLVQLYRPAPPAERPDSELLRRVLHGLRSA